MKNEMESQASYLVWVELCWFKQKIIQDIVQLCCFRVQCLERIPSDRCSYTQLVRELGNLTYPATFPSPPRPQPPVSR